MYKISNRERRGQKEWIGEGAEFLRQREGPAAASGLPCARVPLRLGPLGSVTLALISAPNWRTLLPTLGFTWREALLDKSVSFFLAFPLFYFLLSISLFFPFILSLWIFFSLFISLSCYFFSFSQFLYSSFFFLLGAIFFLICISK